MSLRLAAIVPHPPILVPSIGKENILRLEKTKIAYTKLEEALSEAKIDTIVIISTHGPVREKIFSIAVNDEFEINFEQFGDFSVKMAVPGDQELAQNIREELIERDDVQAISVPVLDHGCGIPLYSLLSNHKNIEVVPLYVSGVGLAEHYEIGAQIRRQITKSRKKIMVLASGDLSHRLSKKSPAGYSPKAAKFDAKLIECLQEKNIEEIFNFDEKLINEAKPCGLKSLAILLGIIGGSDYDTETMAYESPFGVGYLTMLFKPFAN